MFGALALVSVAAAPAQQTNPFNAQLRQLSPFNRLAALRRAVTTSDGECRRVTLANDDGLFGNLAKWSVRCTNGDYAVFLGPGGEVQLRDCGELAKLKLPACTLPPLLPARPVVRKR